tara:strand:+ start:257 stop:400 length:144 start_codon:yes stop_codon:yes gene_type:complete
VVAAVVVVIQETDLMVDLAVVLLVDFLDQVVVEDHMVMMVEVLMDRH